MEHRENFTKIIIVDDGSADLTYQALEPFQAQLEIVKAPINMGQHAATIEGLKATTAEYVLTLDDDLPVDLKDLSRLLEQASKEQADLIYASYSAGSVISKIGSWVVSWIMSLKYNAKIRGSSTRLIQRCVLDRCFQTGFSDFLDHDLLVHASKCQFVALVHKKSHHPSRYSLGQKITLFNRMLYNR